MILNVSGSIGYPFRSGFGSDNTNNPKNQKKNDPFGIYVGFGSVLIHFYWIRFGLDFWVRFICPVLGLTENIILTGNYDFMILMEKYNFDGKI